MTPGVHPPIELDEMDLRILAALHADARLSARALGRAIGMSAGAVGERLDRLQKSGTIRGFRVEVDPLALGFGLEVVVGLQVAQGAPSMEETLDALLALEAVQSVFLVTGQWDLLVRLLVHDPTHLRTVVLGEVWSIPAFRHAESMVVLEAHHSQRSLPERVLAAQG